jgi:ribosomal protein L7Ae-like RNA K-turn-binding protein
MRVFHACDPSSILGRGIYWYSINIVEMNNITETNNKQMNLSESERSYQSESSVSGIREDGPYTEIRELSSKVMYFRGLVERVKGYGTREAISESTLLRKGRREAHQSLKSGEARLLLISGNLTPPQLLNPQIATALENDVPVIKFANSSDLSRIMRVSFPINILCINYIPDDDQMDVKLYSKK